MSDDRTNDEHLPDPADASPRWRAYKEGWDNHPERDKLEAYAAERDANGGRTWVVRTEETDDPDMVAVWLRPVDPLDERGPGFLIARHPADL